MAAKKKGTNTDVRRDVKRALALSEQVTAALVDACVGVESTPSTDLAEAVKALRAIARTHLDSDTIATSRGNYDGHKARWMRGHARGVLHRMGLNEKESS